MKVAIVGLSPTHDEAPWDDPTWEKWGLAWDVNALRLDRVFEIHDIRDLSTRPDWEQYQKRLQEFDRLYIQHETPLIPNGIGYPNPDQYFASSMGYIMAMAIEEADEIGIWGVDMRADDEYAYQRPNMEFLIGLAMGKGRKVCVHPSSDLLKFTAGHTFVPPYIKRYGWMG